MGCSESTEVLDFNQTDEIYIRNAARAAARGNHEVMEAVPFIYSVRREQNPNYPEDSIVRRVNADRISCRSFATAPPGITGKSIAMLFDECVDAGAKKAAQSLDTRLAENQLSHIKDSKRRQSTIHSNAAPLVRSAMSHIFRYIMLGKEDPYEDIPEDEADCAEDQCNNRDLLAAEDSNDDEVAAAEDDNTAANPDDEQQQEQDNNGDEQQPADDQEEEEKEDDPDANEQQETTMAGDQKVEALPDEEDGDQEAEAEDADASAENEAEEEDQHHELPDGDWVESGDGYYWSDAECLYYHTPSGMFFDADTEQWYDPETETWFTEEEEEEEE